MQTKYALDIFPQAQEDIKSIYLYINEELCNPTAARNQVEDFYVAFERVRLMPESCPKSNNEYVESLNLRKIIVNNYIAFYSVNQSEKKIEVVRVLYGMMNFKDIL